MKTSKLSLKISVAAFLVCVNLNVNAALVTDTLLAFDEGYFGCPVDILCINPTTQGSYFALDYNGDGVFQDNEKIVIAPGYDGGIIIGRTQLSGPSIPESPVGAGIDKPQSFDRDTVWHETTSPVSVVKNNGASKDLDFSGWSVNWNGSLIALGLQNGIARINCETSECVNGELFTLDYSTIFSDPINVFGGTAYGLHLEGVLSAVPVPAAVWLFSSGLIGLLGFAGRKKS